MGGLRSLLGPLCAVLGRSWGLCWRSGGGLGTYVGDLELLLGLYGRSWAALGASIGGLGCTWAALGAYVGDLGPLLGLYWRSWAALGAYVGGLGPLVGPMLTVLGRFWGLCWRPWGVLGPKRSVLGLSGRSWEGSGPRSAPNPSGNRGPKRVKRPKPPEARFSTYEF